MYLLSSYGERHEDRLPEGIFSSLDKIREYLTVEDSFITERLVNTDYNNSAVELILFYLSKEEFEKLSEEEQDEIDCAFYIAEQWELDGDESEQIETESIEEILPIENFKDPQVRNNYKVWIIKQLELAQDTNIRGITSDNLRGWLKTGSEAQIRELLSELEKSDLIISTGSTRDKKYSIAELAEKAKAQYEKECDERKLRWNQ